MKWLAIANPAAGRGSEVARAVAALGAMHDVDAEIVATRAPGEASRIAREARAHDGVIAIGGDGTIGEVLQGLDLDRHCLAVLPAGHGNCLARDLGTGDLGLALDALRAPRRRPLDLMEVAIGYADGRSERRLCASTLALGYVTDVVSFGRTQLGAIGRGAYAAAAMVVVPRSFEARLGRPGDSAAVRRYTGIVVNNTEHLANFRGFPDASVHDGRLDVMEQGHGWPRQLLHNLSVLAGSRAFGPRVMRQSTHERIELVAPKTLMADGELLRDIASIEVRCLPAAVACVVRAS